MRSKKDWQEGGHTHTLFHVYRIFTNAEVWTQIKCVNKRKQCAIYIYNGILFSLTKNEILPLPITWINLEGIMLKEISQAAFLVAQTVKRLPALRETRVRSLGREDPLEKKMAIHSRTLAWKIPWTEDPDRLQSMGSQRVGHD